MMKRMKKMKRVTVCALMASLMLAQGITTVYAKESEQVPKRPPREVEVPEWPPEEPEVKESDINTVRPQVELVGVYLGADEQLTTEDFQARSWKQNYLESSDIVVKPGKIYDCLVKVKLPRNLALVDNTKWDLEVCFEADIENNTLDAIATLDKRQASTASEEGRDSRELHFASGGEIERLSANMPVDPDNVAPKADCWDLEPETNPFEGRLISWTYCYVKDTFDGSTGTFGVRSSDGVPIAVVCMAGKAANRLSEEQSEIYLMLRLYAVPVETSME